MFWVILGVILFIGLVVWIVKEVIEEGFYFLIFPIILFGAVIIFICSSLGLVSCNKIASTFAKSETYVETSTEIYALQDNIITSGTMFLGTGLVNGEPKYYIMQHTDEGYKLETYDTEEAIIVYIDGPPRVDHIHNYFTNPIVRFFCGDSGCNGYIIYIPENSIISNYEIDLK